MPSVSTTQARINELSSNIHNYNHAYYCSIDSKSSLLGCNDETYDSMVREIEELEKQNPEYRAQGKHWDALYETESAYQNEKIRTLTHILD